MKITGEQALDRIDYAIETIRTLICEVDGSATISGLLRARADLAQLIDDNKALRVSEQEHRTRADDNYESYERLKRENKELVASARRWNYLVESGPEFVGYTGGGEYSLPSRPVLEKRLDSSIAAMDELERSMNR